MSVSKLKKLLEEDSGYEEFRITIPHPLLPPRYRAIAENRNMILVLDDGMTTRITWEGSRLEEYHPLTPGAVGRLCSEVRRNMTQYRKDMVTLENFIRRWGEKPFDVERPLDPPLYSRDHGEVASKEEPEELVAEVDGETLREKKPWEYGTLFDAIRERGLSGRR